MLKHAMLFAKRKNKILFYRATSADESLDFYTRLIARIWRRLGLAKPREVFQKLTSIYNYPEEYIIWSVESSDGEQLQRF